MAIPWLVALKSIPWGTVIEHGPKVLDKARDLVNRRRDAKEATPDHTAPEHDGSRSLSIEELSKQVIQMQVTLSNLSASHTELSQSVADLTQQNRQLAAAGRSLRRRVAFLVAGLVVIGLVLGWKTWMPWTSLPLMP